MNKSKIILATTGGVIGIAVLVMGYLVWSAFAAKGRAIAGDDEEGVDGLETVESKAESLSRKGVYPCAASVKAVVSNETLLTVWKDEALKLASRGDRPVKPITSAQFKADLVEEAKRLLALPGTVQGRIAKPEFAFGPFKDYIVEGKMPAESRLTELQRQWDDIALVVETLAGCGICELQDVAFKAAESQSKKEEEQPRKGARRKTGKGDAQAASSSQPDSQAYVFTFTTRPIGFIRCLNALETCERFIVVEDFTFTRERDVLVEALGGGEKEEAKQTSGRRRRRGAAAVEKKEENEGKPKNGIITDPLLDAPVKVVLTVVVHDFKTLAETAKAEAPKEEVGK